MASTDILSQTLSSITAIKLDQLERQKEAYETKKRSLCDGAVSEADTVKRTRRLLDGVEELRPLGLKKNDALSGLGGFLDQAEYDPSVTEALLKEYEAEIHSHLGAQANKYEFASLYGKLVEEWIASGTPKPASTSSSPNSAAVGHEEMHQQRATWEGYIFKAKKTDTGAIKTYLEDVFSSQQAKRALEDVVKGLKTFQKDWDSQRHFTETTLETTMKSMLRSDMLTDEKRTTLRGFLGNKVVLSEIADVLNMRMSTIANWTWGTPLIVEQRRNLNGRYRFHTDEDLLHSVFVYYIGLQWAAQLRKLLSSFTKADGVWKSDTKPISKSDARRRRFFLNDDTVLHHSSVQRRRDAHFRQLLLDQLPHSPREVRDSYGGLGTQKGDTKASHVQVVQNLLQRIQTEVLLQKKFGKEIAVVRSDFKWFGPSVPHSTVFAVLEFFGVQPEWLDFFKRVLEAEIKFKQDAPETPARTRKRGTPISTPVADFFAESILFCLDYAVNQKASGARLYRLHDDMWLFGSSETCGAAWSVVTQFTDMVGLELNLDKTGSVRIAQATDTTAAAGPRETLPEGDVKWGFLKLDPVTGRFLINQGEVDQHIEELRLQLSACRSVLDYIQAWNIYGNRFFAKNFGEPANIYGRAHIDSMLATFRRISEKLFPDQPGGVGGHIKHAIASRFGIPLSDIPDGYLYWPSSMGGLGLQNPFVNLLLHRRYVEKDPEKLVDEYLKEEEYAYKLAKDRFLTESLSSSTGGNGNSSDNDSDNDNDTASTSHWAAKPDWRDAREFDELRGEAFMSFEEYTRYRERTWPKLCDVYDKLIAKPILARLRPSREVTAALVDREWRSLSEYEQWVVQLYHRDMIARFGGLSVVDQGLLPTGLMTMLRESRFRWQG